ncbi:hypothetical protein QR680_004443 [Steinernema hermaphroditum]|uniref:SCP domain-containing protein n=1 Tax=Steinernema hermaphroditum TaxID=289476 RepID=A0AA39HNP5_9BILA|nr:hypothetical protein QR680_004443 [Steinernema hermaphroditum]
MSRDQLISVFVLLFHVSLGARFNATDIRVEATAIANRIQEERCKKENHTIFPVYWMEGVAPALPSLEERLNQSSTDPCGAFGYESRFNYTTASLKLAVQEAYKEAMNEDNPHPFPIGMECPLIACNASNPDIVGIRCFFNTYRKWSAAIFSKTERSHQITGTARRFRAADSSVVVLVAEVVEEAPLEVEEAPVDGPPEETPPEGDGEHASVVTKTIEATMKKKTRSFMV